MGQEFFLAVLLVSVAGLVLLWLFFVGVSAQAQTPEAVFDDISADDWHYEYVVSLQTEGVFDGTECDEGFCPGQPLLRREMAVWLMRALGEENLTDNSSRFADISDDDWWTPYIERMADLKITVGCGDGTNFCPERPVSRAHMAAFLGRALSLPPAAPVDFEDVDEDSYFFDDVNRLYAAKITVGCGDGTNFCPTRSVTRAQMAAFIYRSLEWVEASESSDTDEDDDQTVGEDAVQPSPGREPPPAACDPDVFCTEENDFSRLVKSLVDQSSAEHPWLLDAWRHSNRPDFIYYLAPGFGSSVSFSFAGEERWDDDGWVRLAAYSMRTKERNLSDRYRHSDFIHELAHLYTGADDVVDRPGPLGAAYLYFGVLAGETCDPGELYADAARMSVPIFENTYTPYWSCKGHLPTPEALEVIDQAFSGQMPDWLYETFGKNDGSLDYEALWAAIEALEGNLALGAARSTIIIQLKDEFGGYCSESALQELTHKRGVKLAASQPWRDGGC